MNPELQEFLTGIGLALLQRDAEGLVSRFAGWLGLSESRRFLDEVRAQEAAARERAGEREVGEPESLALDDNPATWDELRNEIESPPPEISGSNFVKWCCLTLQSEDESWTFYEFWCVVVREDEGYRIGYFEIRPGS